MANPRESELHYPFADQLPAAGGVIDLAPGLKWVRMGLPFALDHINLWLLRDVMDTPDGPREGWCIVDCGVANEATRDHWERVFAEHLEGLPVLRVLVTHFHPDHVGLAAWLCRRWSGEASGLSAQHECRLWMSNADFTLARLASTSTVGMGGETAAAFFARHGLTDPEAQAKIRARASYYPSMVPEMPLAYRRLRDGQSVRIGQRNWRCILGLGHSPEHISLFCEARDGTPPILISGDMVLPRISTNVSVVDVEPEADPLRLYLNSLAQLNALSAETLVLPAHGRPFTGLHQRIAQLQDHHRERLDEVREACRQAPCHAAGLLSLMFKRPLDLHQTTFAMGEAIAHLNCLWLDGALQRIEGPDGVFRFQA